MSAIDTFTRQNTIGFFQNFPRVSYPKPENENQFQLVPNIIRRFRIKDSIKNDKSLYQLYTVQDSDKPSLLAKRLYGSENDFWILMLMNDLQSLQHDWVMDYATFEKHIQKQYPGIAVFLWNASQPYIIGENVYVTQHPDIKMKVLGWDQTLKKLVLDNSNTYISLYTGQRFVGVESATSSLATRVVQYNKDAVHHFSTNGSATSEWLNPLDSTLKPARGYALNSIDTYAVTNENYELNLNDNRRKIKVLQPRYADSIRKELTNLWNRSDITGTMLENRA